MDASKVETNDLGTMRANAYARLSDGLRDVDGAVSVLIAVELASGLNRLTDAVQTASDRLVLARSELDGPRAKVDQAQATLDKIRTRIKECQQGCESEDIDEKVESRILLIEYEREEEECQAVFNAAMAELAVIQQDVKVAEENLSVAQAMVTVRREAIKAPFTHPIAQQTESYVTFRAGLGSLIPVLLKNDDSDPEWAAGMLLLHDLDRITGTVPVPIEPEQPELHIEKAPTAREIIDAEQSALQVDFENARLAKQNAQDPRGATGPMQEGPYVPSSMRAIDRPAMQLPGRKKKGKR